MTLYKKLFASVSFVSIFASAITAWGYETTTFSVALNDSSKTGTISIGESNISNGTSSITVGSTVYNVAYQYFTPTSTGTYVFGQLSSPVDSVVMIYSPLFTPASPNINYVESNDDGDTSGIADAALKSYVDTAIATRSCGGNPGLCPLLASNLTAGVDYYIVVSTYSPGSSLGSASDTLSFFVIGADAVGVGGVPPTPPPPSTNYSSIVSSSPVSGIASYLDANDGSGGLSIVATYLNGLTEPEVVAALKTIFPVNAPLAPQMMGRASGQTAAVLIEKAGTVLGSVSMPSSLSFANGSFDAGTWLYGDASQRSAAPLSVGFLQQDGSSGRGADDAVLALASTPYQKFQSGSQAVWVQGVGGYTKGRGDSTTLGYDAHSYGVVSGYEYALTPDALVGVIGSLFRSHVDLKADAGETGATTYSLGVYGQYQLNSYKLTGIFTTSYSRYKSERFVSVGGITGSPEASYGGWGTNASLQASKLFTQGSVKFEPFAAANFTSAASKGYQETGGGVYNMDVEGDATSSAGLRGGLTIQYDNAFDDGSLSLKLRPYAGYRWELNGASTAVRLAGAASSTVLNGRDSSTAEYGLAFETSYKVSEASTVKLGVDASHTQDENTGIIYAGYGIKF